MVKKTPSDPKKAAPSGKPSSLVDTHSNRNYEVFRGETKEKRAFDDRHGSTAMETLAIPRTGCYVWDPWRRTRTT